VKNFVLLLVTFIITAVALGDYKESALATDLCGGTGGNGQIVSVEANSFTLKRNDDGSNQIIHLTNQALIKASQSYIPLRDLKKGERVTLVGGQNPDGSFTADDVFVCAGTQNVLGQTTHITTRNMNPNFNKVSGLIDGVMIFFVSLVWIGTLVFLRLKKKKSFVYLLFFTIFYVYLYKVIDYTLLQFQSLLLLRYFVSGLLLNGVAAGKNLNLIPLIGLGLEDVKTSLLNILLMMPFGFGLPFITSFRMKKIVIIGILFSISIEFLQLITGLMAKSTFRIADVNDVIFNALGVAIGYMLFVGFVRNFRRIFHNSKILSNSIFQYIAKRPQTDK
jgi:glycopeptide antibiotics resistance protein